VANDRKIDSRIPNLAPGGLFVSAMGLVSKHPRFGPTAPLALLPADFLDSGHLRRHLPGLFRFNFVEQYSPGNKPIESLLTGRLTFHLQAGWPMHQHHARRRFIHILASMPSRSHKSFFNIRLTHPQGGHPLGELLSLVRVHGKCGHRRSLVEPIENLKEVSPSTLVPWTFLIWSLCVGFGRGLKLIHSWAVTPYPQDDRLGGNSCPFSLP